MASSGNFCNFSIPLRPRSPYSSSDQITGGGLSIKLPSSGGIEPVIASMSPNSGKWYWEYRAGQGGTNTSGRPSIAVSEQGVKKDSEYYGGKSGITGVLFVTNDGGKRINGSDTSYGNTVSQHDIVQIALDCDNGAVYFGINNTWQNSGNPESGASKTGAALSSGIQNVAIDILHVRYVGGTIDQYNFGQDDTFGGAITAAGNADGNGHGVFKYAPPTGFLALCSANLPTSSDIDPGGANGADENPTKQFGVYTYTGDSGSAVTVSTDFQPDLIWIKNRSATDNHYLQDSSRGFGNSKSISSNANGSEGYQGGAPSSSGAQSVGSSSFQAYGNDWSKSTNNFIAWCWKANGGTTASNSEGAITSTVQANPAAGFSIVQYTGTGSNLTMGHGLTKAPEFMAVKNRDANVDWNVYHVSVGYTKYAKFNSYEPFASNSAVWNAAPTADVINIGNAGTSTNGSGADYVCYAWHGVDGYSRFSTYTGNGNADGPFIFTGFRPKLVYLKKSSGATAWNVFYSPPKTFNSSANAYLTWDTTDVEANGVPVDFLSNGFKIRSSGTGVNENGGDFVYGAWGDVPLKYNNTF